jgi:hypothetical protein
MFTRVDDMDLHFGVELEARQQLGRNEEVLTCTLLARNVHHALVHHAFVTRVHDAEWRLGEVLQGHEVKDGGNGTLATGLAV